MDGVFSFFTSAAIYIKFHSYLMGSDFQIPPMFKIDQDSDHRVLKYDTASA